MDFHVIQIFYCTRNIQINLILWQNISLGENVFLTAVKKKTVSSFDVDLNIHELRRKLLIEYYCWIPFVSDVHVLQVYM